MAKTLRTSQDYTIKAGDGAGGSHVIKLDSRDVRVTGNLVIDGDQIVLNTQTLSIEDPIIVLNRNTSSTVLSEWDSGILVNRGESNNAALYWDGADDVFKAVTTTSDGSGTEITETALSNIRVAEPSNASDAATRNYVDNAITTGSMSEFYIVDQNGLNQTIQQADTITFASGQNINTEVVTDGRVIINLDTDLSTVNSITASTSFTLVLGVDTDYNIVINNINGNKIININLTIKSLYITLEAVLKLFFLSFTLF